jgi:uncharacterized membrane protein
MSRSYPELRRTPSADEAREQGVGAMRGLLVALTLLAIGALLVACLWCANHPHSAWTHALTAALVVLGILVVGLMALAPVATRQAGGRR